MPTRGHTLSPADHAAWLAARLWGGRPWDRLAPSWRGRLLARPDVEVPTREEARAALRAVHQSHATADLDRVHLSWMVRALQDETSAVQHAVVSRLSPSLREALRDALAMPSEDRDTPLEPHPEALAIAEALWSERLVGGPPHRPDDPPVVRVLTEQAGSRLTRLLGRCALAKRAYVQHDDDLPGLAEEAQGRLDAMRSDWQHFQRNPVLEQLARHDLGSTPGTTARDLARVGLLTPGRLLAAVDPIRTRWTLQHLPYALAKPLRAAFTRLPSGVDPGLLLAWEGQILAIASEPHEAPGRDEPNGEVSS